MPVNVATIRLGRVVIPRTSPVRAEEWRPEIVNHPVIAQSNSVHTAVQRHDLIVVDNHAAAIRASQRVIVLSQIEIHCCKSRLLALRDHHGNFSRCRGLPY